MGDEDRRESLSDMCKEVRRGNMPVMPYLLMHKEAALARADVDTVCAWTDARKPRSSGEEVGRSVALWQLGYGGLWVGR